MELKVFEQKKSKEEQPVYLRLIQERSSNVVLIACDRTGKRLLQGDLLRITENGDLILSTSINPDLGFNLDNHGQLKIER